MCFPHDEGRTSGATAQIKAKARARSREVMSEGAEQTPDVSSPRQQLERPPIVFVRGETLEPSTARPKVRISRKSRPQSFGDPAQERRFSLLHGVSCTLFSFLRREILHGLLCKDDTYIRFFFFKKKKSSMAPVFVDTSRI